MTAITQVITGTCFAPNCSKGFPLYLISGESGDNGKIMVKE